MSSAARYHPRAPRYVFKAYEQRLMRFKPMDTTGDSTAAQVRNVSSSGLSFIVPAGDTPFEGEMLKIEFALPGKSVNAADRTGTRHQLAWFADVMRVENRIELDSHGAEHVITVVALRFHRLPPALKSALDRSLDGKSFASETPEYQLSTSSGRELALFAALTAFSIFALTLMALPPHLFLAPFRALF